MTSRWRPVTDASVGSGDASGARLIERIVSSLGRDDEMHFAAGANLPRGLDARLFDDFGRRGRDRRLVRERPASVLLDADGTGS